MNALTSIEKAAGREVVCGFLPLINRKSPLAQKLFTDFRFSVYWNHELINILELPNSQYAVAAKEMI